MYFVLSGNVPDAPLFCIVVGGHPSITRAACVLCYLKSADRRAWRADGTRPAKPPFLN